MDFQTLRSNSRPNRDSDVAFTTRSTCTSRLGQDFIALTLCLSALASVSCGSSASSKDGDCQGIVPSECPATYDEALTGTLTCQDTENIIAGHCMTGGPLAVTRNWGTHQSNCFYDSSTRKLIGANVVNDTKTYCNGTSETMSTGKIPIGYPYYCTFSSATTERSLNCRADSGAGGSLGAGGGLGAGGSLGVGGVGGGTSSSTGGATGGADGGAGVFVDGGETAAAIVGVDMTWTDSADAGATVYGATAKPDGTVSCKVYGQDGWMVAGTSAPDQKVQSLLVRVDVDTALATTCLLQMADVGSPVVTTLADGSKIQHLVFGSCATTGLNDLTAAIRNLCGSMTIVPTGVDGGRIDSLVPDASVVDASVLDGSTSEVR
jgi:hypothetical protein